MLSSLHCEENGHMRTWNIHNAEKTLYIGIEAVYKSFVYNWKANNKSCKMIWKLTRSTCIRYILVVSVI